MTQISEKQLMRRFITQSWKLWLLGAFIGGVIGITSMLFVGPSYEGSIVLTLNHQLATDQGQAPYYTYDGYYSKQSAIVTQADLAQWIKSAPNTADILTTVGINTSPYSIAELGRIFKVSETRTSILEVKFSAESTAQVNQIGKVLADSVKSQFNSNGITITASNPLATTISPNYTLIVLGSVGAITIMAFGLTLVISYFRND